MSDATPVTPPTYTRNETVMGALLWRRELRG